jgi:hypothetical protein
MGHEASMAASECCQAVHYDVGAHKGGVQQLGNRIGSWSYISAALSFPWSVVVVDGYHPE